MFKAYCYICKMVINNVYLTQLYKSNMVNMSFVEKSSKKAWYNSKFIAINPNCCVNTVLFLLCSVSFHFSTLSNNYFKPFLLSRTSVNLIPSLFLADRLTHNFGEQLEVTSASCQSYKHKLATVHITSSLL